MIVTKKPNAQILMVRIIVTADVASLAMDALHVIEHVTSNVLMVVVQMHQIINVFAIWDGQAIRAKKHAVVIIIQHAQSNRAYVTIAKIGRKVKLVNDAELEAMAMQHQSKNDADHANATAMATKHSAFVIFKRVNVSVNTIRKEIIVKNVVRIIMVIQ